MLSHNINPIILKIGPFYLAYYSLVYIIASLFVLYILIKNKDELKIKSSEVYDCIILLLLSVIVGARIFHILFWRLDYFLNDPIKIFYIWQGGVSFHGGLIGAIIFTLIFCKIKKISFLKLADTIVLPIALMGIFLRLANFINQEIVGTVTDVSWCFKFKYSEGCRHPVQIYASAGRTILFLYLLTLKKFKSFKDGFLFWNFILLTGAGRFLLDFLREDLIYAGLKSGQWFSLLMIIISLPILIKHYKADITRVFK